MSISYLLHVSCYLPCVISFAHYFCRFELTYNYDSVNHFLFIIFFYHSDLIFLLDLLFFIFFFFFFKQKTAYEMRISDWSSDVCSSDLLGLVLRLPLVVGHPVDNLAGGVVVQAQALLLGGGQVPLGEAVAAESRQVHQVDVLHVAALAQVLDKRAEGGGLQLGAGLFVQRRHVSRSEEHTSELQSLMRISY